MHTDESHVHLHAYALHPSGHADRLHPGKLAKKDSIAAALDAGHDKKSANAFGDKAYVTAMRSWQDSYSQEVGLPHGLTRLGPARRRLSRGEWKAEQAAAKSVREARTLAKGAKDELNAANGLRDQILEKAQQEARLLALEGHWRIERAKQAEAAAALAEQKAKTLVHDAYRERDRIVSRARVELRRLHTIGGMIRAFWDSLRVSSIRRKVRQEVQDLIDQERARAAAAMQRLRDESSRRLAAETRLADVIQSAHALGRERDEIRRERDRLLDPASVILRPSGPKFP